MEFRRLKYFIVVAEERHITRAAVRLGMAQPPLSQQIHKLEDEIGAPLFHRLTRGVELTDAGRVLYEDAKKIIVQVELAQSRAQSAARGQTGSICVGFAGSVVFHPIIGKIVGAFRESHPQVMLSPSEDNISALMDDLMEGRIDLAIIRQTSQVSERVKVEALLKEDMLAVLPPQHRLGQEGAIELKALAQDRLILFPRAIAPALYDDIISACLQAGFSPLLGQESTQVASAVSMVAAGFGVSIVPETLQQLHAGGVTYHPLKGVQPKASILLAYRPGEHAKVTRDFITVTKRVARAQTGRKR